MESRLPEYETILNILREAGFVLQVRNEIANINGAVIVTAFPNLISSTADDAEADNSDVVVLVNGAKATIAELDAEEGLITLANAPQEGDTVAISYYYSPVTLDFVEVVREDAECGIYQKMKGVDPCAPYEEAVPYAIRMSTRLWAAGLLLAREYGYNVDTELSSKDGYRKIEEAKSMLEELYKSGGACVDGAKVTDGQLDVSGGSGSVLARSEGDLFGGRCHKHFLSDRCFERC